MEQIISWLRKIHNPVMGIIKSESDNNFQEMLGENKISVDKITLTLIEKTPSGPYWEVRVEGGKDFSLVSDVLVINLGHKRPAIRFTKDGMSTICPKCGGEVRYEFQNQLTTWRCKKCGHHKLDDEKFSP